MFSCFLVVPKLSSWFLLSSKASMVRLSSELGFCEVFKSLGYVTCFLAVILLVALVVVLIIRFEHRQGNLRKLYGQLNYKRIIKKRVATDNNKRNLKYDDKIDL